MTRKDLEGDDQEPILEASMEIHDICHLPPLDKNGVRMYHSL